MQLVLTPTAVMMPSAVTWCSAGHSPSCLTPMLSIRRALGGHPAIDTRGDTGEGVEGLGNILISRWRLSTRKPSSEECRVRGHP